MAYAIQRLGWKDLTSDIVTRNSGTSTPSYAQIGTTGFFGYEFVGTGVQLKECQTQYHLLHDLPAGGGEIHIHTHWLPATAGTGNVKWNFSLAYAKGHNQAAFNLASPVAVSVTTAAPAVQYQHMISEVVISATGGAGGLFDPTTFETDGILIARIWRDPTDLADTYAASAFVHMIDCHYLSNHSVTLNKQPPFDSV